MDKDKLPILKGMYEEVKKNTPYTNRLNKLKAIPVFKKIIWQTLQNAQLTNEHLTGLIHMFKHDCTESSFDKYLEITVPDAAIREKLSEDAYNADENGFTNAGKRAIQTLDKAQLLIVKRFLLDAFKVNTPEQGINLCKEYIKNNLPIVTEGIYSPWLFYINPQIFPLVNQGIKGFKSWIKLSKNYDQNIQEFSLISEAIGEDNFGLIDALTTSITKDGKLNYRKRHFLNTNRLYKISHGIFVKGKRFYNIDFIKTLEENNWISLSRYTKKGKGLQFEKELQIGDIVYICYGGDTVYSVAKVISEAFSFDKPIAQRIGDNEKEWIYRKVEHLYFPVDTDIRDLKYNHSQTMPSGNSTFWECTNNLEMLNDELFIPKFNLEILKSKTEDEDKEKMDNKTNDENSHDISLNTILYGPPGTGKTYHSISYAVAIIENKNPEEVIKEANYNRTLVKKRYDEYVNSGLIVFTTFHQSLSYEDFIEGIKPIEPVSEVEALTYAVEDGIFKRLCTEASFSFIQNNTTSETEKVLDFSDEYDRFVDSVNERFSNGEKTELKTRSGGNISIESISQKNNIWVRHIDGNRMYTVSKKRLSKISQAFPELNEVTNINDQFRAEIGGSNSSAYWAVLNAIRKQSAGTTKKETKTISEKGYSYDDKKEIIQSLKNDNYKIENARKFVLIIDEINRGNVSQIFGELITLIENDKRLGKKETLKATLPYSKESFGVPHNLHVIGTMNTADRSVEALDTALRRRFSFVHMAPNPAELKITDDYINLPEILSVLNNRLSVLKDSDHTIGHAWLWSVTDLDSLKIIFKDKILPLLQEYFYNDSEKLGLVLGDAFFKKHEQINSNIFASFTGGNGLAGQYDQTWLYHLKSVEELTITDFKSLELQNNQLATGE